MQVGKCPMCNRKGIELTTHHVVEAPPGGSTPKINLCRDCHNMHEKYRNYLRDTCNIEIDRTHES